MRTWSQEQAQSFFRVFDDYWPGRMKPDPQSELVKTWRDVAQKFDVSVAVAALREIYEGQERPQMPSLAGFKAVAIPMQAFVLEKARQAEQARERGEGDRLYTAQEIAADDEFWVERFERAKTESQLDWLEDCRERLRSGGPILETRKVFEVLP